MKKKKKYRNTTPRRKRIPRQVVITLHEGFWHVVCGSCKLSMNKLEAGGEYGKFVCPSCGLTIHFAYCGYTEDVNHAGTIKMMTKQDIEDAFSPRRKKRKFRRVKK